MSKTKQCCAIAAIVFGLSVSHPLHAENADPNKKPQTLLEKEAIQSAAEDEAEYKSAEGKPYPTNLTGKITMLPADTKRDDLPENVVARFKTATAEYYVKAITSDVKASLPKYEGKEITLGGKIRNNGKYFIVTTILDIGVAPPTDHAKRGGF